MGFHIQMQYSADSFEAPNAPTCRIDHVVAVFYAVFFRAANQKITDSSGFKRRKGIFFTPDRVNGVQFLLADGFVRIQFDILS